MNTTEKIFMDLWINEINSKPVCVGVKLSTLLKSKGVLTLFKEGYYNEYIPVRDYMNEISEGKKMLENEFIKFYYSTQNVKDVCDNLPLFLLKIRRMGMVLDPTYYYSEFNKGNGKYHRVKITHLSDEGIKLKNLTNTFGSIGSEKEELLKLFAPKKYTNQSFDGHVYVGNDKIDYDMTFEVNGEVWLLKTDLKNTEDYLKFRSMIILWDLYLKSYPFKMNVEENHIDNFFFY